MAKTPPPKAALKPRCLPMNGKLIGCAHPRAYVQRKKGFGTQPPATLFRRAFTLSAAPRRARLYATCLGVYRLTVNGKRPDMREFAPEHTSYKGLLCFQTYDLTALLHIGENVLGMEVGDGWYCCPQTQPPIEGLQPDPYGVVPT